MPLSEEEAITPNTTWRTDYCLEILSKTNIRHVLWSDTTKMLSISAIRMSIDNSSE